MFASIIIFFSIFVTVSNWNDVREALYPEWNKCVDSEGIVTLEPPERNEEKQNNNDVLFVLLPNEDNMKLFQPKVWLLDAYDRNRLDVMKFLLINGSKLPTVPPMYCDTESQLALELNNLCREEYVSLFLLYEPIEFRKKLHIISPYVVSFKIDLLQIIISCIELLCERMLSGCSLCPEYEQPSFFNEFPC